MIISIKKGNQVLFIALGKILAMLISFFIPVFLTRFLSKDDYGLYAQFYTVTLFLTSVASFGLPASLFFFFPSIKEILRGALIRNVYVSLVFLSITIIGLLQIPVVTNLFFGKSELSDYITLISICILFILPTNIVEPLYTVNKDNTTALLYKPFEVVTKIVVVIIAAIIGGDLRSILIGIAINHFILFLFATIYVRRVSFSLARTKDIINTSLLRKQVKYSFPFGIAIMLNTLARHLDKIIAITFLTITDYATYTIAFFGIPGIMQIYDSLCNVYIIRMAKLFKLNDFDGILGIYKELVTKTLSFSVPLILIVFLYAKQIVVFLFTEEYTDSVPLFRTYILYFVLIMIGAGLILRATGKTKLSFKAYLFSSVISVPCTYFAIKYFGIWGGVSSAIFSQSLPKVFQIKYEINTLKAELRNYLPWLNMMKILLISLLCFIPFLIVYVIFDLSIYVNGVLALLYLLFVYAIEISNDLFVVGKEKIIHLGEKISLKINRFK